jgi:hypothetical protein
MSRSCLRTFCSRCEEEMIHRDNRRAYESASGIGQIVSRDAPRTFTVGDVDLYVLKFLGSSVLLRLLEHKQPASPVKPMQRKALRLLDELFAIALRAPDSRFHPASGVYLMRGAIGAEREGRRATYLDGPQELWNPRLGGTTLETQSDVFAWLDGRASREEEA